MQNYNMDVIYVLDKQKLAYDLSLLYAKDVLENRPRDKEGDPIPLDCIEVNKMIFDAFKIGYEYHSLLFGLTEKEVW